MNRVCLVVALCGAVLAWTNAAIAADTGSGTYVDTHMHLMVLPGGGRNPPRGRTERQDTTADYLQAAANLIKLMDEHGVKQVLLMPPPQTPGQKDRVKNTAKHIRAVVKKYPTRILPVLGGNALNPLIHGVRADRVTQADRDKFQKVAEILVKMGAKAFGEMSVLHIAMSERHNYSQTPADHPLFLLLADISAKNGIPIDIHMEAVAVDSKPPASLSRVSHNPKIIPATIPGFERLLKHNRKARIVWQHIGWDNMGQMKPPLLRRLLTAHPNLFLAIRSEQRLTNGRGRQYTPNEILDEDDRIRPEWKKLFVDFPDRIVVGGDEFIGIPGKSRQFPKSFSRTWMLLKQLPATLAKKIGYDNPTRIYHLAR